MFFVVGRDVHRPNGSARIRRLKKYQPQTLRRAIHRHFFLIFLLLLAYLSKLCATLFPPHATIDATDAMKNSAIGEGPRASVQVVKGPLSGRSVRVFLSLDVICITQMGAPG